MVASSPPHSCRFIRELIEILAIDVDVPWHSREERLFRDLSDLEMDAERFGANELSCRVIGRIRRLAGECASVGSVLPPELSGS